ncbi:hypothetical protein MUK42_37476 [Musa troglodytarum]|uniref:Uncharacterized protein n=1 Tax=Musa troglodytarum TaxID=320322 RepID=A0A9E7GB87_9LILI|nr:hypothetical protein MUK42_37476 [Musa troglodytarum]
MTEHEEEGRMARGGEVDKASEAPNMGGNIGKVESVGALYYED